MKSRVIGIALVVALLVGGAVWIFMGKRNSFAETAVRELLESNGIQAEIIDVTGNGKNIHLENIRYAANEAEVPLSGDLTIKSADLNGFNIKAFTPSPDAKLPLVAENIQVQGLQLNVNYPVILPGEAPVTARGEISVGEIAVKNWRQNVGNVLAAHLNAPFGVEFFNALYRYSMDDMYTAEVRANIMPGADSAMAALGESFAYTVARIGLLGKVGSADGNIDAGRRLSWYEDDTRIQMGNLVKADMGRREIHDLLLPTSQGMVDAIAFFKALPPEEELGPRVMDWLVKEYSSQAPYSRALVQDYSFEVVSQGTTVAIRMDEMESTLNFGTSMQAGFGLKGLTMNADALLPEVRAFIEEFTRELKGDMNFQVSLAPAASSSSSVSFGYALSDLGKGQANMGLDLQVTTLGELLDVDKLSRSVLFRDLAVEIDDRGLLAMLLCLGAQEEGLRVSDLLETLDGTIRQGASSLGEKGPEIAEALTTMLEEPGNLKISLKPAQPMSVEMLAMAVILGMQGLDLNASATPGPKALMDYVPASFR